MIEIHADTQEQPSGIIASLKKKPDAEIHDLKLHVGDYDVGGGILIERKREQDFINSMLDGRFHEQMLMLTLNCKRPAVIIEGDIHSTRSKFTPANLAGGLAWIFANGISLIHSPDAVTTAEIIYFMAKNAQTDSLDRPLRANKPKITDLQVRFVLEGFPSIGPGNAKKAIEHFGSLKALFNATPEELVKIPRIGKDSAQRIWDIINWHAHATVND